MPVLAGWLTGEQVPYETIDQTLTAMGGVLGRYGGTPAGNVQAGSGLLTYADTAYAMQGSTEPPVLDWVPDRRTLVYRRPLSGMHPLYFIEDWPDQGNLLFASEMKALFNVGVPRRFHLPALAALLRYGFIPAPWTIFKDIQVVPAGSILRWQRAKTVLNSSTDYHFDASSPLQSDPDSLATLLKDACATQLPVHDQLVALTSGSPASALATFFTAQQSTVPFTVASLGYTKSLDAKAWTDAQWVAAASERPFLAVIGVDQPDFWSSTLTTLESPVIDTRSLALQQLLHTVAAETGARVAMSGLGASLFFRSKRISSALLDTRPESQTILPWYAHSMTARSGRPTTQFWSQDTLQVLQREEPWEETLHARKLARAAVQFADARWRTLYLDLHLRLPDLLVGPLQQLGTQARLMIRSPYLTPSVMESLLQHATHESAPDTFLALLVQRYMPDFPLKPTKLPLAIPTKSFAALDQSELLQQMLSSDAIRAANIFAPEAVETLIQQAKGKTVPRELFLVFTTQLLHSLFNVE
ncbi:MAG: hypothetical protein H0U76_01330 [Ktedonobacteraceae bacterium]|nr:hypothetical protein [Ktedonobacteraceae bacterium]